MNSRSITQQTKILKLKKRIANKKSDITMLKFEIKELEKKLEVLT